MDILYQDPDIVVAVKPRGVLSEAGGEETMPALLAPHAGRVWPIHRLDRAVGGVMVYAKNATAAARLSAAVREGALCKTYHAVVTGVPKTPEGELRDWLYHDQRQNKTFVADSARKAAKEAILRYRVLQTKRVNGVDFSRLLIELQTGRSHQIRVQFASRKMPLVGDGKYGSRVKAPFLALAATVLRFPHPKSGREMTFSAPTPTDFPWNQFAESHYEIERKFLIAYPAAEMLAAMPGCRVRRIEQTYLTAAAGETRRVRLLREGTQTRYIYTVKRRVNMLRAVEEEAELSASEYLTLLQEADPTRRPVRKTRYCIPCGPHTAEIDLYDFWQDRATLEVELAAEDERFTLPACIQVIREVTEDERYKNVNLARELPAD
ncbi:MAG: hypothetical protein E7585_04685 [Ruminococcaceae bacterium]|nr:hypothetical protein [Oscillospiraceae bacterium]